MKSVIMIMVITISLAFFRPPAAAPALKKSPAKLKRIGDIELIYIEPGTFRTSREGAKTDAATGAAGKEADRTISVEIRDGFYIGKYEVTHRQYVDIVGSDACLLLKLGCTDRHPAMGISWYDTVEFCNALSRKHGLQPYYQIVKDNPDPDNRFLHDPRKWRVDARPNANGFRLPTEDQWEYAYRAGSNTLFYWGNARTGSMLDLHANYFFNSGHTRYKNGNFLYSKYNRTKPAGKRRPNVWGLHDMAGNVAEWCFDSAPLGADEEALVGKNGARILRGGSYMDAWPSLSALGKETASPVHADIAYGMRLVLPAE